MTAEDKRDPIAAPTFADDIRTYFVTCNVFTEGRNLRAYQACIYQTGDFPRSGLLEDHGFRVVGSLCLSPKSYAWLFRSSQFQHDVWLLSGDCAQGYAIRAAFAPGIDCYVLDGEPDAQSINQRSHVLDFYSRYPDAASVQEKAYSQTQAVLCVGHENYAHFMWNELGALLLCEALTQHPEMQFEVLQEPIAPIGTLWRSAAGQSWRRSAVFNSEYRERQLAYSAGGFAVTSLAKERIRSACEEIAGVQPRAYVPSERFVLWVSLKVDIRQATNLNDALTALFQRLNAMSLACDVFLDGFSPPFDLNYNGRYPVARLLDHQRRVRELASELIDRVAQLALQSIAIYDLSDLSIPASMSAARHAHYYVCHNGTQQHKIAWLYDVPGTIHSNPYTLRNFSTWWTAEMALTSLIPKLAPVECIDAAFSGPDRPNDITIEPYVISDIDMFVNAILPDIIETAEARLTTV